MEAGSSRGYEELVTNSMKLCEIFRGTLQICSLSPIGIFEAALPFKYGQ
jgi:hypothetical protein